MNSPAPSNWPRIGRDVLTEYLKWFAAIWAIAVVITATAIVVIVSFFGTPTISIVDTILNSPRYWLFVIGLIFTYQWLGPFVTGGVTRRDFVLGGAIVAVGASLIAGAICATTVYAEGRVYAAAGWDLKYEQPHLFNSSDQWGLMLVEFALVFGAHFLAGWVLGTMYYRYGAWATIAAIPVFGFAVATEIALGSGWAGRLVIDDVVGFEPSWSLALLVGAAAMLLLYAMVWRLVRDIAIIPKRS